MMRYKYFKINNLFDVRHTARIADNYLLNQRQSGVFAREVARAAQKLQQGCGRRVAEAALPGYEVVQWNGVLAPARVPAAIIARLNSEIERILALPEMKARLIADGADPAGGPPEKFAAFMRADIDKWAKVIKAANVTAD